MKNFMKALTTMKKHEEGQGLVEYALILVLVAVVVIVALSVVGDEVSNVYQRVIVGLTAGTSDEEQVLCQIYTIEGYDTWDTNGETFPGSYAAPWTSISQDQPTNPGLPICTVYGGFQP